MIINQDRYKTLTGTTLNWITMIINLVIGLILTPLIIHSIGAEGFGAWTLLMIVFGYSGFLDMGISGAALRYMARYRGTGSADDTDRIFTTSLVLFTSLGIVACCLILIFRNPLTSFFTGGNPAGSGFNTGLMILSGILVIIFPSRIADVWLRAGERWITVNGLQISAALIRATGYLFVLARDMGLPGLTAVFALTELIRCIATWIILFKSDNRPRIRLGFLSMKTVTTLATFGITSMVIAAGDLLRFQVDETVITGVLGLKEVAVYAAGAQLFRYLFRISIATFSPAQSRLSVIAGQSAGNLAGEFLSLSYLYPLVIMFFGIGMILLAGDFLLLWLPAGSIDTVTAARVTVILTLGLLPDLMTGMSLNLLQAINRHRYYAVQTILEGVANIALSLVLVRYWGLEGVALGTAIPALITRLTIQPVYIGRCLGIHPILYLHTTMTVPVLGAVMTGLIYYMIPLSIPPGWGSFILNGLLITFIYTLSVGLFHYICGYHGNSLSRAGIPLTPPREESE